MKNKLLLGLLLLFPNICNSTEEYIIIYGITLWEPELLKYEGINRTFARIFSINGSPNDYFRGKADAYSEIIDELRSRSPYNPLPYYPTP